MITSMDNAQVKHLARLSQKARYRRQCGLYVVEGPRMAREVPEELLEAVYVSEQFAAQHSAAADEIRQRADRAGAACECLSDAAFAKASDTVTPQGVLCVVRQRADTPEGLLTAQRPLHLLLLENIQDPGNLGTMLRTGEAAGITGIIADDRTVDLYNPKTVRGTMGAIFRVPYVTVDDLTDLGDRLREADVRTAAMAPDASADYTQADFTGGIAFLIGNEGNGLSRPLQEGADLKLRIPMEGRAESLNAAVAAALCMYETKRQRDEAARGAARRC